VGAKMTRPTILNVPAMNEPKAEIPSPHYSWFLEIV
jgi:hypothetical protein